MKGYRYLLALAVIFALAPAARAALEFAGYTTSRDGVRFVVTDLDAKKTSDWLRVGDAFQEYTITAFDARTETLTLERAGATLRLPLKGARTTLPTPAAAAPAATGKPEQPVLVNLTISSDGSMLLDGATVPFTDDTLRALFQKLAKMGTPVALAIRAPARSSEISVAAIKQVMDTMHASGIAKGSLRLITATAFERTDPPPVVIPKPTP